MKYLQANNHPLVTKLSRLRLDAGDKEGARRILQREIELDSASTDPFPPDVWPLIFQLAQAGGVQQALAIAEAYLPKSSKEQPVSRNGYDKSVRWPQLAMLKAKTGDISGAIETAKHIGDRSQTDMVLLRIAGEIAGMPWMGDPGSYRGGVIPE